MKKIINLKKIINIINKIYEDISNVKILQDELEDLLDAIDKINLEYNKGKISKEVFERDGKKFKTESLNVIKKINKLLDSDLNGLTLIENEVAPKNLTKSVSKITQTNVNAQQVNVESVDNHGNQ
ncbi:MAG: hypothetical protein QXD43_02015 [Candidatus Aenigmatarchaeota archaeon]